MKSVAIKSIYGKTLAFKDYTGTSHSGAVEVTARDDTGAHKMGMVFSKEQIDSLREALKEPVAEKGVYFLLRQRVGDDLKIKVCYASSASTKEFTSLEEAQAAAKRQNENYGDKWTYFVAKKETV